MKNDRAASAIKKRLSKVDKTEVKGAKLAEHRADMMLELYTKAAKQRALRGELENVVGKLGEDVSKNDKNVPEKGENVPEKGENVPEKGENVTEKGENVTESAENKKASQNERGDLNEHNEPITIEDVKALKAITAKLGKISINNLPAGEIKALEKWAYKYWNNLKTKTISPFFRAWFGDWRESTEFDVDVVDTKSDNREDVINEDTGWVIKVSRQVHKETSNHKGSAEVNAVKYLPYIDDITKKAILFDSILSDKDNENSLMFHTMYAYSEAMGYPALLKLQVEELFYFNNTESGIFQRDYILQNIEEESLSKRNRLSRPNHSKKDSSVISIAELYDLVKGYEKKFNTSDISKAVNPDGTPMMLYHQTGEEGITVFDPRHKGAGTNDDETPFGIFMKPTDADIGLKGKKQMALYARIVNPLMAKDRADLVHQLKSMSSKYAELLKERDALSVEYKQKIEDAAEAWGKYAKEYRQNHPDATRAAIYEDAEFKKLYDAEDVLTEEWIEKADALAIACKEEITKTLEANNYDGVIIENDQGSGGRSTKTYIALKPEQVKSATDNIGTFDKNNPDIRYDLDEEEIPTNSREGASEYITDEVRQKRMKDLLKRRADDVINKISAEKGSPKLVRGSAQAYNFKVFSETESKKLVNSMIFELNSEKYGTQFEGYNGFGLSTRENKALYDQLFKTFNLAKSRADVERAAYGYADFVISHAAALIVKKKGTLFRRVPSFYIF